MRNKRGFFMGAYMVVLTLFLCGVVIGMFYIQQKNIPSSLVSPRAVLEVRDDLKIFEMREVELIEESLSGVEKDLDFCGDEFSKNFRENFIFGVSEDSEMMDFIFSDLTFNGEKIGVNAERLSFLEEVLYSDELGDCDNGVRIFRRAEVGKFIPLRVSDNAKINFPVNFSFEFEKEYSIEGIDGGYLLDGVFVSYKNSLNSLIQEEDQEETLEENILAEEYTNFPDFPHYLFTLNRNKIELFHFGIDSFREEHEISLIGFLEGGISVRISSETIYLDLIIGKEQLVDINGDGFYDVMFKLISYDPIKKTAVLERTNVHVSTEYNPKDSSNDDSSEEVISIQKRDPNLKWAMEKYEERKTNLDYVPNGLFDNLPWRSTYPNIDESKEEGLEFYKANEFLNPGGEIYGVPCGPAALHQAFFYLGKNVDVREIIAMKQGGFLRGFLSIFTHAATHITWPGEIAEIAESFGFDVERIKGKKATLETAALKSTKDSVVILRVQLKQKFLGIVSGEHFVVYDTTYSRVKGQHFFTQFSTKSPTEKILELYVIKKKGASI